MIFAISDIKGKDRDGLKQEIDQIRRYLEKEEGKLFVLGDYIDEEKDSCLYNLQNEYGENQVMVLNDNQELQLEVVLEDIRDDANRMKIIDRKDWNDNPGSRHEVYAGRTYYTKIDAERWPLAILSYKKYGCFEFSENKCRQTYYSDAKGNIIYVREDGTDVKLAADILTGETAIMRLEDKFKKELKDNDKKILKAFYRVSYTIGNFCMIWKNPSGNPIGIDHVWRKIRKGLVDDNKELIVNSLENRSLPTGRKKEEMLFVIFKDKESANNIIDKLYFKDYFGYECKANYGNLMEINDKDEFIKVVKDITILIIQRGYRIVRNYHEDLFGNEQQQELNELFEKVGFEKNIFIHSEKRKMVKS